MIILTVVLLPAPLGPTYPRISPGRTAKLTSSTAGMPLKRLERWRTSSIGQSNRHRGERNVPGGGGLLCGRRMVRWGGFLLNGVSNRAVALQPPLIHPGQHRDVAVHVAVDLHESFVVVETMQPAHILLKRALPGDRHGQE